MLSLALQYGIKSKLKTNFKKTESINFVYEMRVLFSKMNTTLSSETLKRYSSRDTPKKKSPNFPDEKVFKRD